MCQLGISLYKPGSRMQEMGVSDELFELIAKVPFEAAADR
jgi:hypothetical protein